MDVADQLKTKGRVSRGWLGVLIQDVTLDLAESFGMKQPRGALVASDAQIALGITGIAGPGGGSSDKPVGLVCFSWALRRAGELRLHTESRRLGGDRAAVRTQAIIVALEGVLQMLAENTDV